MTKDRKLSARRQKVLEAQLKKERQQRLRMGGVVVAVLVVLVALWSAANLPKAGDGERPVGADRTAWGPVDAPVVIEEWSDFN